MAAASLRLASTSTPPPVRGAEDQLAILFGCILHQHGYTELRRAVDRQMARVAKANPDALARDGWIT